MKIFFMGSAEGRAFFQEALTGEAEIISDKNAECAIVEIPDQAVLFRLPKKFAVPTYFYITKKDRQLFESIKDFKISGLFFPPLKKEDITKKLLGKTIANRTSHAVEFDTLKAKIIAKAENIPPLPSLARELVRLTRNDQTRMKDFVSQIKKDQGLSSRIIKLVNSPFYGLRQEISSIDRATVFMGLNTVKNLALAVSTESFYNKNFSLLKTTGMDIWQHGFNTARICETFAKMTGEDEDALYLAGLMHDIGKVVIVDFLVKEAVTVADERDQLGTDHCAVGELILTKWSVVKTITEAVRDHHSLKKNKFNAILYYANLLENGLRNKTDMTETLEDCAYTLRLTAEQVASAVSFITEPGEEQDDHL